MNVKHTGIYIALLLSVALCGSAMAGPTWICAIVDAVSVDEDGTVGPPDLDGLERPTFLHVDADKMTVTLLAPESRRGEVTKIKAVYKGKCLWIFSGEEERRAWSMVLSEKGHMTLSVTSDGGTWSIFGHTIQDAERLLTAKKK